MKSLIGILRAEVAAATVRTTDSGKEFLSVKAVPITDKPGEGAPAPVWVRSFHKTHITAKLIPGMRIRAEGPLFPHYYEQYGQQRCTLRLDVAGRDDLTMMVDATAAPFPDAQPAGEKEVGQGVPRMKALTMPVDSSVLVPSIGSVTTACRSELPLAEKPPQFVFPAEITGAKSKFGGGFDEKRGDDIRDLF